ncbi:heat shock 70 kDa protein 12A-like [Mizuhopecten yessoensis]|uniref:heat shock 70 kDa protein 12A-like n=1 Tax=Mizuhopecten yessoensis TaxID=6573 RepID=UPI000B45833F|nr:heat shock 70 kDa protein 12A-like [Mizuhopecten yessoensis]XP_021360117.1 heat shock 70 kDa protein 12A-like [Mizuhopecten yessoensis]
MASAQKLLVVAIDFGTTYSGYAFSFYHEYKSNKKKVRTYLWPTGIGLEQSTKAPTSILFDSRQKFHSFGYQAEDTYTRLPDDHQKQWYYFKRFKMTLFKNENLNEMTRIKDVTGREMRAMNVFSAGIKYLRDHFHEMLQERSIFEEEDIQWVLTVPAIWNDAAKQFMRKAAVKAGINGDRLTLALEPEAAALYCKSNIRQGMFPIGHTFMIVDSGGGTVDVTAHKVHLSDKLQEVLPPSGGPWGGTKVDDAFQTFLVKVFGLAAIRKMSKAENLQIEREFEIVKRSFNPEAAMGMSPVNIWIPYCLRESLGRTAGIQQPIKIRGDKMSIPHQTFASFFDVPVQKIVNHVRELIAKPEVASADAIYLVGGLSDSKLLQAAMIEAFPHIQVHIPVEATSAVLKGAVIFGHDSDIIGWRMATSTYGTKGVVEFDHGRHPINQLTLIEGIEYCSDVFSKFITVGTTMRNGQATPYKSFSPVCKNQAIMPIRVIASPSENLTYTTDPGCRALGTISVRMPDLTGGTNRAVKVRMILGGTELKVEAVDENTGLTYAASFDCF